MDATDVANVEVLHHPSKRSRLYRDRKEGLIDADDQATGTTDWLASVPVFMLFFFRVRVTSRIRWFEADEVVRLRCKALLDGLFAFALELHGVRNAALPLSDGNALVLTDGKVDIVNCREAERAAAPKPKRGPPKAGPRFRNFHRSRSIQT